MSSRIEQIIQEIEEYVDSCKFQPLSTTKIVVNKEEIEEYLRELRLKTPDEIKRYQKIISNKDAILEDAQTKADALIADAQNKAQELVTQHEIMQKAYAQANETINAANRQAQEILDSATQDANSIRLSAITYTDDMMANIGSVLTQTLEDAGGKYKGFIDALQACMDVVNHNRQELAPQTAQAAAMSGSYQPADTEASKEDEALLDEIGDMPLVLQTRLLRVLEDRLVVPIGGEPEAVNVRIISATHRDLAADAISHFSSTTLVAAGTTAELRNAAQQHEAELSATTLAEFIAADVRDYAALLAAMAAARPEIVLHLAAQPLVPLSYAEPVDTFATNAMGTHPG